MKTSSAILAALAVVASTPTRAQSPKSLASPDSFGLGDQVLHVPAADFQHTTNKSGYEFNLFVAEADGYLHYTDAAYLGHFVAPLFVPAGAQIFAMCTYVLDSDPAAAVGTSLEAVKLAAGSIAPGVVTVVPYYDSGVVSAAGYGVACIDTSYTYRNTGDVDGDGALEDVVHQIRVVMTESGAERYLAFGGVRVFWRHQVSPPPASPSFDDVQPDDLAYAYVEALAASGIDRGCGVRKFCPDDPVTRRQAAVFLARALGLYWPY